MKPTIFLDIDGVLNSARTAAVTHYNGKEYTSYTERHFDELDPIAVGLIKIICDKTNADIVISSTWRKLYPDVYFFQGMFRHFGWAKPPVVGLTPSSSKGFRGEEICMYLDTHPELLGPWVAIDDDSDFYPEQPLVKVDGLNGFSYNNFKEVLMHFDASVI